MEEGGLAPRVRLQPRQQPVSQVECVGNTWLWGEEGQQMKEPQAIGRYVCVCVRVWLTDHHKLGARKSGPLKELVQNLLGVAVKLIQLIQDN